MQNKHVTEDGVLVNNGFLCHFSWTAVIAGALVAIGLGILFNVFGLAIGLSATNLSDTGQTTLAIGGFIGLLITIIVSMLAAGYTTGFLSRHSNALPKFGILYGFSTWVMFIILAAILTTPVSNYLSVQYKLTPSTNITKSITERVQTEVVSANSVKESDTVISESAKNAAWTTFLIFIMLFFSALSTCLGTIFGLGCKDWC